MQELARFVTRYGENGCWRTRHHYSSLRILHIPTCITHYYASLLTIA